MDSASPFATDSAPPFAEKRSRARRQESGLRSVLRCRGLWLAPLLSEAALFLNAFWLMVCFHRLIWMPAAGFPWLSFFPLIFAYAGLAVVSRSRELVMPRAVVAFGVGSLAMLALVTIGVMVGDALMLGNLRKVGMALLVSIPPALFFFRCILVFREAKFAPSLRELGRRCAARPDGGKGWAWLRFWMN